MKMRVAFVSVVPSPYQRDLFRALNARTEIELSVFYLEAAAPDSPWPERPLAAYERILPGFWFPLGNARCHLNWNLPQPRNYDVIVLNTLMSLTGQWMMRTRLGKIPWIFWGERLRGRGFLHRRLTAPLHRASGIAAIGSMAQQDYAQRFPEPHSFCIPYYCELAPFIFAPREEREPGEIVFLFCGQMIARKGLDLLLAAFARLDQGRLLLVGREAELPALLGSLPPETRARISYAGFQPPEALPAFFARADVFVLPSRYDGWGVVVNQALGAGLPIICSDAVGAAHDLVEDGVNGVKFASGNVAALTDALRSFLDDPARREAAASASRKKASAWHPEVGAGKWVDALQEVLRA
ncbi:MAG TPA: glycosyltransferase family 4 protein [Chthoniobacteraceae bacterium]|jgi:glycosyltransferase involved in cell wall biosynthesis